MRPSRGEALALIFCFPAGTQALLVFLWLLSSSKIWHMVFSWKEALTQHCVALKTMLWNQEEWEREINRRKASVSPPLPFSFVPSQWHLHARHNHVFLCCSDGCGGSQGFLFVFKKGRLVP